METISDIVEALKFYPMKTGRMLIRLLRHPEPILTLLTEPDPLSYGPVKIMIHGELMNSHCDIICKLCQPVPEGKALAVVIYPRKDLQRMATEAEFSLTDLTSPGMPATGAVELHAPGLEQFEISSHWALPMPPSLSSSKMGKKEDKKNPPPAGDPESIFDDPK